MSSVGISVPLLYYYVPPEEDIPQTSDLSDAEIWSLLCLCGPPTSDMDELCVFLCIQGLNQDMRQHESAFAAEHLRMMANRNATLETKVTAATTLRYP